MGRRCGSIFEARRRRRAAHLLENHRDGVDKPPFPDLEVEKLLLVSLTLYVRCTAAAQELHKSSQSLPHSPPAFFPPPPHYTQVLGFHYIVVVFPISFFLAFTKWSN